MSVRRRQAKYHVKEIVVLLLSILFPSLAVADDHTESGPFYAFYHLQVDNPAALVAAMDKFWASDCGKKYPADVGLSQELFNGSYTSTHFVINTFQSIEDQDNAAEIMRSCADAQIFLQEISASAQPVMEYMGPAPVDENDWGQDSAFSKFDIIVEPQNQAVYAAAYMKMMKAAGKDIKLRSYGLGAVFFGRDKFSHWVWTGARTQSELAAISEQLMAHPAFSAFNTEVGSMRTIVNTTQVQVLKNYARN